jgi:hypothetical protein
MTALYLVGDVFERVADLRRRGVRAALVLCSPPFLALRSYLPDGHPLKGREIGSEATPAAFVDVMLALVAELGHVLAPWGSIAFELGDTYAGSGGAGGDHDPEGGRFGQNAFTGSAAAGRNGRASMVPAAPGGHHEGGAGWPMAKSLAGIPQAFMLSLAYGYNVLDRRGPDSPAGRWMVRNLKPWIRSNPPVGSLGDKERPATSYVIVATRDPARYFDLDAVRTAPSQDPRTYTGNGYTKGRPQGIPGNESMAGNAAGAPPLDWCHSVDMVLDAELDARAGKPNGGAGSAAGTPASEGDKGRRTGATLGTFDDRRYTDSAPTIGARGVHLRRALERAGILTTLDALDVSLKGYRGAHYAVWPPELVRRLVLEMCPRRVCSTCGQPSRRINGALTLDSYRASARPQTMRAVALADEHGLTDEHIAAVRAFGIGDAGKAQKVYEGAGRNSAEVKRLATEAKAVLGGYFREFTQSTTAERSSSWSDCGHDAYEPGIVLDPFVGSGTTLQVVSGMGLRGIGIDLDYTNVGLAIDRVGGLFLDVEWPDPDLTLPQLAAGSPHPASYDRWRPMLGRRGKARCVALAVDHLPCPRPTVAPLEPATPARRARPRPVPQFDGQGDLFTTTEPAPCAATADI